MQPPPRRLTLLPVRGQDAQDEPEARSARADHALRACWRVLADPDEMARAQASERVRDAMRLTS